MLSSVYLSYGLGVNVHAELLCYLNCPQKNCTIQFALRQEVILYAETEQWGLNVKQLFVIRGTIVMPGFLAKKKKCFVIAKKGKCPQVAETVFLLLLR